MPAQLVRAPRARSAATGQRPAGALGIGVEHRLGRLGLHHHDAEAVGHDVVHLARDPGPLLGGGRPRLGLARALGALGALGELLRAPVALVEREADQPGDAAIAMTKTIVARVALGVASPDEGDRQGDQRGPAGQAGLRQAQEAELGGRDQDDHVDAERVGDRVVPDGRLHRDHRDGRGRRRHREAAAGEQRQPQRARRASAATASPGPLVVEPDLEDGHDDHRRRPGDRRRSPRSDAGAHGRDRTPPAGERAIGRADGPPHPRG